MKSDINSLWAGFSQFPGKDVKLFIVILNKENVCKINIVSQSH